MRSRKDLGTGLGYTFEQKRVIIKIRLPWGYFEGGSNLGDYNTLSFISDQKLKQQETPDLNVAKIDSE